MPARLRADGDRPRAQTSGADPRWDLAGPLSVSSLLVASRRSAVAEGDAVTAPELGEPYRAIRDEHVAAMLALRFCDDAERDLLRRMMAHGEVARRQVSARLDPVQTEFEL